MLKREQSCELNIQGPEYLELASDIQEVDRLPRTSGTQSSRTPHLDANIKTHEHWVIYILYRPTATM